MAAECYTGNDYRTTLVCIDSYDSGVPVGRFYNPYYPDGKSFSSLTQFLISVEDMLNAMNFPQPFRERRTFSDSPRFSDGLAAGEGKHNGKLSTFKVRVLFRQNADWQGSVTWVEGEREESFRSGLELIFLMDSAIVFVQNS